MSVVGWDIGGANLKQVANGHARSIPFELWRHPQNLTGALTELLSHAGAYDSVALTMTGELADCFRTKADGVRHILDAAAAASGQQPVRVWSTEGRFVTPEQAAAAPLTVAAANWHALATWTARSLIQSSGLLIDIGSTTTDIIPLHAGRPCSTGLTDPARLQSGELIYTGVRRTPLCALQSFISWRGMNTPVAAELFATTLDAYLLTGEIPEDPTDRSTANGEPATIPAAHDRLARMLCCDCDELPLSEARELAEQWGARQREMVRMGLNQVLARGALRCETIITSGSGEFLVHRVVDEMPELAGVPRTTLRERLGPTMSAAACAFAVAMLAEGELPA